MLGPFDLLGCLAPRLNGQSPQQDGPAHQLDHTVNPEGREQSTMRKHAPMETEASTTIQRTVKISIRTPVRTRAAARPPDGPLRLACTVRAEKLPLNPI